MTSWKKQSLLTMALVSYLSGCTLTSNVSISPLILQPGDLLHQGSGVVELVDNGDYRGAIIAAIETASNRKLNYHEMAALGRAEMASGRFVDARRHLRASLEMHPYRTEAAQIAWDLSQTEYLSNQYAAAKEWADIATENGIGVREWHVQYVDALSTLDLYRFEGSKHARLSMNSVNPAIPRINVKVNGDHSAVAVVDSGAVLSIISDEFAKTLQIKQLGDFEGTFYGLLGEPITVRFAVIEALEIGKIVVRNVPVAIMADAQLNFFIANRRPFKMDLLLGANLLKEFRIELDFRRARAEFTHLEAEDRKLAPNQNMFFVGFRPFVQATINRKGWFLFVLDTGSEITFLNGSEIANTTIRNSSQRYHSAVLQGLGGSSKRGAKVEDVSVGIDRWSGFFRDLPLYHTEQTRAFGILGENFLNNFTVTIDFGKMRLDLDHEDPVIAPQMQQEVGVPSRSKG